MKLSEKSLSFVLNIIYFLFSIKYYKKTKFIVAIQLSIAYNN